MDTKRLLQQIVDKEALLEAIDEIELAITETKKDIELVPSVTSLKKKLEELHLELDKLNRIESLENRLKTLEEKISCLKAKINFDPRADI